MAQKYFSILTNKGIELVNQHVLSGEPFIASNWYISLGNGNMTPSADMTELVNPIYDKTSTDYPGITFATDSTYGRYAQLIIPDSINDIVTEMGLFNENNELIAVANTKIDLNQSIVDGIVNSFKAKMSLLAIPSTIEIQYINNSSYVVAEDLEVYQALSEKAQANGYAPLDDNGIVPEEHLPVVDLPSAIELRNLIKSCKLDNNGDCDLLYNPQEQQEIIQNFTQPILTSNGTVGGDSFASFASSEHAGSERWKAFDNNANVGFSYAWQPSAGVPQYLGWYNNNPIKCSSITIRNAGSDSHSYVVRAGELQYSDDGTSWNTEQTFTNDVTTNCAYWTFNVDTPVFSKYKRLYITQSSSSSIPIIQHLQMNGALELVQSATGSSIVVQSSSDNPLIYVNPDGTTSTITSQNNLDFASGYSDGKYSLIQLSNGTVDVTASYTEARKEPTSPANNDYWLNTSVIPNKLQKYEVSEWVEKQGVFIGSVNVASNLVSSVEQPVIPVIRPNSVGHTVVETYVNGASWYRVWSDGWCEQGGIGTENISTALLKTYIDTNYQILLTLAYYETTNSNIGVYSKTTSSFVFYIGSNLEGSGTAYWRTSGYIS